MSKCNHCGEEPRPRAGLGDDGTATLQCKCSGVWACRETYELSEVSASEMWRRLNSESAATVANDYSAGYASAMGEVLPVLEDAHELCGAMAEPCLYDHHGLCQAHNLQPKGMCWAERLAALLEKARKIGGGA